MDVNKVPGPLNILVECYQCCKDTVKHEIMQLFGTFHKCTLDVQHPSYRVIKLLPIVSGLDYMQQFWPIGLLGGPYKLITKVMDRRVEKYAEKLISPTQNAFVKGRNIMDRVLSLHELLNYTHVKKRVRVVIKLDFEKVA